MGPKKGKKLVQEPQKKKKKAEATAAAVAELSAIAPGSFIEGLQQNDGDIRHSTALEEDLLAHTEEKQVQKKRKEQATNPHGKGNKRKQKSTSQNSKKPGPAANTVDRKKTGKRKSAGDDGAGKPAKKQKKKLTEPESGRSSATESQEQADGSRSPQSHRDVFTSDEELEGSWEPSPKERKVKGFGPTRSRTSSSDKSRKSSGSGSQTDKGRRRKKVKRSDVTPLDVVLDEFLDFFEQYKETVESSAVKKALDFFASNVEKQLTEQISSNRRLKALTRENTKMASAIHTKRQRLLDAKDELMKSERQLWLLQKEKSELEQKSEDLKRSKTFLQNIRELNARYLKHRRKHPDEKETYGASSLPALLIEAKHVQTTELQLKAINNRLQNAVKDK